MTSKDVYKILNEENGQSKLYKKCEKNFALVDSWEEKLTTGDLLDEYELSECIDKLTGCIIKFAPIAGALEAIITSREHNKEVEEYSKLEKEKKNVRSQDCSIVRAKSRQSVNDLRGIVSDFRNYFIAAEKGVTSAQSRIKRLTVEKSAKGVDYTGEAPNNCDNTARNPVENKPETGDGKPEDNGIAWS